MVKKMNITIPELSGEDERRLYVYLPDSYRWQGKKRYPVLYMFDGHNLFFDSDATYGKSWGLKKYMDQTKTQLIIVAVECSHAPDNGRLKEYSPFTFEDESFGYVEGRGYETMEWMVEQLKPYIDSTYRTMSDRKHTYIAGSSMGGLMALYALCEYNHVFSRAAALSPSLWVDPQGIVDMVYHANMKMDSVLYMDYGENEMKRRKGMHRAYGSIMNQLYKKRILLTSRLIPNGEHTESNWERQLPAVMGTLMYR